MDPVTTAIIAATSAGVAAGAADTTQQAVVDAYGAIKDLLKRKFGANSEVVEAVTSIEAKPNSAARKEVLREEVTTAHADEDAELLQAARTLLDSLHQEVTKISQTSIGDGNIQVSGHHQTINVKTSN